MLKLATLAILASTTLTQTMAPVFLDTEDLDWLL